MLVEMLQIQIGKSQMSDFVDERSQHMRNIAQDTFDQYDRIAYWTVKGLDASGSRVLRQLHADAQAIERELRLARAELEAQELDSEEYQQIVAYSRIEGLFFKNLYPAPKPLHLRSSALSKSTVKEESSSAHPRVSAVWDHLVDLLFVPCVHRFMGSCVHVDIPVECALLCRAFLLPLSQFSWL